VARVCGSRLGWAFLLAVFLLMPWEARAQGMLSRNLEDLGFSPEIRIEGPEGGFSAFFPLPRMDVISGDMLWHVVPSESIREKSLFTFYINDRPMLTRTAENLWSDPWVRVPFPRDLPPNSFLHARVESRMSITEDLCEDRFTGQLFFTVHRDSTLSFEDLRLPRHTVSDFFETLFGSLRIVLPREPSLHEARAAIWLGAFLRKAVPGLSISFVSELREEDTSSFILLAGEEKSLPRNFSVEKGISLTGRKGLVFSAHDDPEALEDMVQGLACLPVFGAIPSDSILPERMEVSEKSPRTNLLQHVQGKGFDSILLEIPVFPGLLASVPETLSFELQGAFTVPPGGIHLPRMDVYWNNSFIESEQLLSRGSFRKKILLPPGVPLTTENRLRLLITYHLDEGMCRYQSAKNRAALLPFSTLRGHGSYPLSKLSWNSFGLFALQKGLFLLDEALSVSLVQSAAEMLSWLSNYYPEGVFLFPEIRTTHEASAFLKNASWIVALLSPGAIPEDLRNLLPLDVHGGFLLRTQPRGTFRYSYEQKEDFALFLLGSSSKPVILLSSENFRMMQEAAAFFASPENAGNLRGNLLAFRSSRDVRTFDTREPFVTVERGMIQPLLERLWYRYREAFLLGLWVLITLFFGSLFLRRSRKK